MARVRAFPTAVLLLLVLIAAGEMMGAAKVAEARECSSLSHRFKGLCLSDHNCASVCNTEGFPHGNCHGFRRRCFCTRPC